MNDKSLIGSVEQTAIYDGEPEFIPMPALIDLLNYHSDGGTPSDLEQAKRYMKNPKRYRVQLRLYVEEI